MDRIDPDPVATQLEGGRLRHPSHGPFRRDVADDPFERSEFGLAKRDNPGPRGRVCHVVMHVPRRGTQSFDERSAFVIEQIRDHYRRPAGDEHAGMRLAETSRTAGHDGDFSCDAIHARHHRLRRAWVSRFAAR